MESGLIFNQLICEFESRRPCQTYLLSSLRFDQEGEGLDLWRWPDQTRGRMLSVTTSVKCKVTIRFSLSPATYVGRSSIGRAPHCDCGH